MPKKPTNKITGKIRHRKKPRKGKMIRLGKIGGLTLSRRGRKKKVKKTSGGY